MAMRKARCLGTGVTGIPGGQRIAQLSGPEGIPVLLVTDSIIKWLIVVLDEFGGGDSNMVKSKENFQGLFLPEYIL